MSEKKLISCSILFSFNFFFNNDNNNNFAMPEVGTIEGYMRGVQKVR